MNKKTIFILATIGAIVYFLPACLYSSDRGRETASISTDPSYNFDIRPILSDKCFACHGPDANKREAGLRLDLPDEAYKVLKENPGAYAIVPGIPEHSQVFLRISSTDTSMMMPPANSNLRLTQSEISLIENWIKKGAKYEKHWAFTPPVEPALPQVKQTEWVRNGIDHFILQKLEQHHITPNPEADKERLLKRVSLDLTGLPPGLQLMDKFLADKSPDAYEKIVEELLKSKSYGERMALFWLDIARFADSHGYQDDSYRSQWPWRDWVIHAFNENYSYKKFISWQLAGDLMPSATKEQILATGFNRNHKITEEGGVVDEEYRVEYVTDRANTVSKGLLGITMECAHCHDHKYDPFSQKEHYQLAAFFNNVEEKGLESLVGGPETYAKKPSIEISDEDVKGILNFINKPAADNRLMVSVMGDNKDSVRKTYLLNRGAYDAHGEEVLPGTPAAILPFANTLTKNRAGLAEWMFDTKNPLTSRVFVNQVWQEFFGRGIVKTTGDFGMQGDLPSHPELLDWLAVDFMKNGWDIKRLVRQLVTSATYRQSAVITKDKLDSDPENILLGRSPRYRVAAEFTRDIVLASSGLLNPTIGGPSFKPYQPAGLWEMTTSGRGVLNTYNQDHGDELYRRGMYIFIKRTAPPPVMNIFDASNRDQCEVRRLKTNTPLQALAMLNDPAVLEASRVLSARLLHEINSTKDKISKAFRLIVCRRPAENELDILLGYYNGQMKTLKKEDARQLLEVGEHPSDPSLELISHAALMQVISTIYNLEETITKS
ncbi:MAG: PSD1 and planctomycete cytochrome C domain-containing protein [Chitinophagaceae bacterium]